MQSWLAGIVLGYVMRRLRAGDPGPTLLLDAPEVTPASEAVFAQAFVITAEAFVRVSQRGKPGQKVLARVTDVRFLSGSGPSAMMHGPLMQITVAPQLGIAGRPSSQRIVEVIGR